MHRSDHGLLLKVLECPIPDQAIRSFGPAAMMMALPYAP
jgi:hypothetical protein